LRAILKPYLPAILCVFIFALCYLVAHPYAEIGIDDDWSYVKSAQVLAQTGHIVYNGWATAMLGWQLYFGALFAKLFGFSFTAVRLSTLIEAMATAFLLQRTMVRVGINEWNASLATMTFVLSPLYFPLSATFMSDVSGVLCIVVCLYMCLRALSAETENSAMIWISLAALSNAVGGTARQIVWLGVLVMVPSTLFLLRRNRRVLVAGSISCIAGICIVVAAMHWFAQQPYSIPTPMIPSNINLGSVRGIGKAGLRSAGELTLYALPVLLMFLGFIRTWNRRMALIFAIGLSGFVLLGTALSIRNELNLFLAPFQVSYILSRSFQSLHLVAVTGEHIDISRDGLRLLLTCVTVLGFLGVMVPCLGSTLDRHVLQQKAESISWNKLSIVLGPFTLAYVILIALRAEDFVIDRYLLALLVILLLVLTRYYQQKVRAYLPAACILLIAIFAGIGIAGTHDELALYRGYVAAIDEIRSTTVPSSAILGPIEYDGWTQVEKAGYLNDSRIRVPKGAYVLAPSRVLPSDCGNDVSDFLDMTPAIEPAYLVSANPRECGGPAGFPTVTYRTWIAPHNNSIYIVKIPSL
jgi:hypothetical protein